MVRGHIVNLLFLLQQNIFTTGGRQARLGENSNMLNLESINQVIFLLISFKISFGKFIRSVRVKALCHIVKLSFCLTTKYINKGRWVKLGKKSNLSNIMYLNRIIISLLPHKTAFDELVGSLRLVVLGHVVNMPFFIQQNVFK